MNIKRKNLALTIAALAGFALAAPQSTQAQTNRYWDPSGGGTFGSIGGNSGAGVNNWQASSNIIWTSSNTGNTSRLQNYTTTLNDIANFGGPTANLGQGSTGIIPVTASVNAHSLVFNNISPTATGTVTLQGGQITLTAATNITVNNNTANPLTMASHTVTSVLAGGATSFTKLGAGNITLGGANLFTGPTTISNGRLTFGNSLALQNSPLNTTASIVGDAVNGLKTNVSALTFGGLTGDKDLSALFTTDAGGYDTVSALTLNNGPSLTHVYSGAINEGAIGMSLAKIGTGTQVLAGANTYTGSTIVSAGTLTLDYTTQDNSKLSDTAALELGGVTLNLSGGTHAEVVGSTIINPGLT
jgi:autotransporter-associated beta strand protein